MAKIDLEGVASASQDKSWEGFTKNFQVIRMQNTLMKFGKMHLDFFIRSNRLPSKII